MLTDKDGNPIQYTSSLFKYFKVNPETTANDDGTKTYAPDAAANGKNSVAIGPSAQAGDKSTDATTSTTTITGGKSSTAIGDSAKANGDQSVALGYGSEVLNVSGSTTAVSGSTAIGSGAKVEGGSDSTALGSGASVDTASGAMALGKGATINKTAASGVAIGNGAVTGSADQTITVNQLSYNVNAAGGVDSVAIGTDASNAGNTSIALGKGAMVKNDSDGNYQAVVKSDDIAVGTGAKTTASDASTAIGKGASVAQSTDALAIGSSAAVGASSNDAMALGKGAAVGSGAADSIAMGTSAKTISADTIAIGQNTSATGANSVVIGKSAQTTSEGGNAIGSSSTASGRSTAIGQSATANNFDALAIGNGATANVDRSISLGYHAGVGTTEGKGDTQTSGSLIAIGTEAGNNVAGMQNIAIGSSAGSDTKSNYNVAIGSSAGYNISYSDDSNNQNGYNVSIGYKANYQDTAANIMNAISIGEKTNAENYAVAIGGEAQATGTNSIALGYKATAADTDSMALGYNSSAANGNIAIGVGSTAPKITMSTAYLTGDAAPSTYISVGTSDNLRRISNVADGSAAQDVVTVHQLTAAYTDLENTIKGIDTTSLNTYSTTAIDSKIADVKSQIANAKTKYFSYSTSTSTLAANADNKGATATAADAMAIGPNANATNTKTLAIGNNVYAKGLRSIAIGTADNPTKDSAGTTTTHNTSAEGENSIALGTSTTAQSDNSVAIGTRAQTYTTDTTKGSITGVKAVAIGYSATTAGDTSVAVGNNATVKYASGTAVGTDSLADGTNAVAIGEGSKAYSDNSTAIGQGNSITGNNTYGLGSSNTVSGAWGSVTTSGVSGYNNSVTSVSDANTMNAISGIYITGNSNSLTQNVVNNVVSDITAMGSSNTIDGGAGGTSGHPNTLSQIAIVGSGNTVQGKSSDDSKTNNIKDVTILGYNNKVDANTDTTVDFSNTQILGSNVTAKLGNSIYLGSNSAYTGQTRASSDAITSARTAADAAAEASDAYKAATTDAEKAQIKAQYEAQYLYKLNVQAMEASGTTAGTQSYSTDETYGDGTSYTYAGSSPVGVVTVGKAGSERRIQNVAAGLVSASSTDAVNGSQLYALTRQIRFGGDNSSFGTTTADDKNVVARGSNETIAITGGSDAVTSSTTDGNTTYTVDTTKLTDNNIAVVADTDKNALHVQLASSLKNLNTAQLGSGSGDSYKETIKLDGTGTNGGQMTLAGADGTVKTTIDTTGLTVANGPKFTSSGIDAASQKINHVTAGSDDADAVNYGQLKNARTLLTQGTNTKLVDSVSGDQHTYTVNVDNLAVKANGTGTTTVALTNGINFKNGTNTTATVGTDGTVTIEATHNKLESTSYTASNPSDSSNKTTLKLKDTDGNETTLNLTDTYTTVSKNTDHTITFKRNDGSEPVSISLDDLNGASKEALNTAAAKATTTVVKGTNVDSVSDDTTSADGHHIYTVNVSNLGVKVADGQKTSVALSDGLVFGNGTNTTASVGQNGAITFNVSNDAIKTQAKDAINMKAGSNVKVDATSPDGLSKTFTISATHNALKSATITPKSNDVSTLTITGNDGDTASVDIKNTHLTVTKDSKAKTVTFTSNDGTTPTTTLSLSDLGAASTADMNAAKAAASTEVKAGTNASLGTVETNQTDQHKIYTVNVDNLGLKQNGTAAGTVTLADGINFADGTNTSATVSNGKVTFDLKRNVTGIDTVTANNSIQAGDVKVGKQGTDNKNYVTGLDNKNWTVGQTTYEAGRAATEDQLKSVSDKVASGFQVTDGTTSANIGADKKVTFTNGNYTTAKVTQATDGANVQYDINTAQINAGANGTITAPTTDGVATAANVAEAINSAAWKITAGGNTNGTTATESIKAGDIVTLKAGNNMAISQSGKDFTYALVPELTGITSLTTSANGGYTATINGSGLTITPTDTTQSTISLTAQGLNNGGQQIANVASGGTVESNAATIGDLNAAIQKASAGTTASGFKTKGNYGDAVTSRLDKQLNVVGDVDTTKVAQKNLADGNVGVVTSTDTDGNATLTVKLNKDITLDSVTTGNTRLDTSGLSISSGPTIAAGGINAGNKTITGVANGVGDNDAVNISQLKAVQSDINAGWTIKGKDSANVDVNANIGKGKTVTYNNGSYTKAVVTKDDSGNAAVTVDVTTGTLTTGTDGKITSADGLATTGDVASAVNGASWTIQDGNNTGNAQQVKAGDTVSLKAGDNLSLDQDGKKFTYKLNKTLENMTSVTAVDDKQNTAVLNGEGLKVSDKEGDSLTQHATEVRLHSATAATEDTSKDVVLNNAGLTVGNNVKFTNNGISAGDQKITGVADGEVQTGSKEAVNGGQLYELQQKVTNGWKITGNDTTKASNIGNDKTVSFVNGDNSYIKAKVDTTNTGATVSYMAQTASLMKNADGKAVLNGTTDGLVTGTNLTNVLNSLSWTAQSSKTGTGQNNGSTTAQSITAGTNVGFIAGDNMILTQNGTNFTYALNSNLTGMNTIAFTGLGNSASNLTIGLQNGGGANPDKGYYITGLSNTKWDQSNYEGTRAATEAQLREAIDKVSAATGTGGFGLTADEGANNGGEKKVSQTLGRTIAIQGDGTYGADGTVVKQGNILTVAYTDNAGPTGAIKVKLNKDIDLSEAGSLTIGASKVSAGSIVLDNTGDAAKKIALNSTAGTASIGGVTVNGAAKTVMGLANTTWDGTAVSGRAATEDQLQQAVENATATAAQNEQHIQSGNYDVGQGKGLDGKPIGKNSVAINVVSGDGTKPGDVKGQVVINNVAKADELGDVAKLNGTVRNGNGHPTSTVDAINNLDNRVETKVGDNTYSRVKGKEIADGDSATTAIGKLNNRMNDIYTTAGQHSTVSTVDANLTLSKGKNASGGTDYKLGLNKEHIDLGNVTINGNAGSIEADSFTAGDTVVNKDGVKVGDKSALTGDSLKVGGKTYVDDKGINANGKAIGNVAAGSADTDAVNVKQVNDLAARQGEAITENAAHIGELGRAVNKLDNRINRVGAGAAALAALHPGSYDPDDKLDVSAGVGNYRGANAAAVGLFFHPNERTILSVAGSMGGGENMVNAGVTLKVGPGHGTPTTVTTRTGQKVDVMDILAKQTEILEKLAGNAKAVSAPAGSDIFPDVPQNHWAYAYVDKLYRTGSLAGFSEPGKLKSHMLTRKDFAEILYWAMTNGATTNPDLNSDGSLNRLAAEFGAELKLVMR